LIIDRSSQTNTGSFINYFTRTDIENEGKDKVKLGGKKSDKFLENLSRMKEMSDANIKALYMPEDMPNHKSVARNQTPVVIVHGTMAEKESIQNYKDACLESGHPTELTTYMTIKEGEPLQKSGQLVSKNINASRMEVAKKNLEKLSSIKDDPEALKAYFNINDNIYGTRDDKVEGLVSLIPDIIGKMEKLIKKDKNELLETFSGKTKEIEDDLAKDVARAGYRDKNISTKIAAEIMDSVAPKAVLVGHSMGGFVSYTISMNPKDKVNDGNEFTYDGGNGVGTVITLSSPVKLGVKTPLPEGLSNYAYTLVEKNVLNPMESLPGMQFCMINPFFSAWYDFNKQMMKEMYKQSSDMSAIMTNPITYAMKPGVEQISEGSDFIKKYIDNKKVPHGITAIAITNRFDGVSEDYRSKVDESQANAHNLDADVKITEEELKKPKSSRPTLAHMKMGSYPFEHGEEFRKEVMENPNYIPRLLDPSNYDGIRWRTLTVLLDNLKKNSSFFDNPEFRPTLEKIKDVAAEKLPFKDSPSFVAQKILERLEK